MFYKNSLVAIRFVDFDDFYYRRSLSNILSFTCASLTFFSKTKEEFSMPVWLWLAHIHGSLSIWIVLI